MSKKEMAKNANEYEVYGLDLVKSVEVQQSLYKSLQWVRKHEFAILEKIPPKQTLELL